MKVIAILAVSLISLGSFAQTTTDKAKKDVKTEATKSPVAFKTLKIERAEIPYDSKEPFIFEFKNNGKTPLIITNVQTSCGCTAAEKPTEPIAKGKSSKIVVNYDTKRVGQFTKTITVTTNASTEPIILTITGKVLPQEAPAETPKTN
ncbi:DUF1573 domain-containing protein [Fluviicola sp.]|uniref:DUF1573 domain-containing protein n=1 Tax=Fluviicola sp. TaxID=1917219 RepID=UPI0031D59CAA